jgi:hypothetical protein
LTRLYGWAPHDQRAPGSVPRNHGKKRQEHDGGGGAHPRRPAHALDDRGAMETATFEGYIREQLGPTLRPGQVVVLANLSVHKAERIRPAVEACQCQLLVWPPYSPRPTSRRSSSPSPKSKPSLVRTGRPVRTKEARWEAMRVALEAITPNDALAWFAHAGYALSAQNT